MTADGTAAEPLRLDADEQELVALELRDFVAASESGRYAALAGAVEAGEIPAALKNVLASVLEFSLQTGRARALYTAEGEGILTGVYRRTPSGRAAASQLAAVNEALRTLTGAPLDGARVAMRTVGHYTVTLSTAVGQVVLAVRPDGVEVHSVVPTK